MHCDKCKKEESVLVCYQIRQLCETCHMHLQPFEMELVTRHKHGYLFNKTLNLLEEYMTIDRFVECGWFIRRKVLRGSFVHYFMEYHGKVKCSRCTDFNFPLVMKEQCRWFKFCTWRSKGASEKSTTYIG